MDYELNINNLDAGYGTSIIIEKLNLSIPKGQITMLIGGNGCGKSTLLKTIGRIIRPLSGSVSIQGTDLKNSAPREIARKMAVLPQSPTAPAGLLVKELVAYGRFPYQKPLSSLKSDDMEIIDWAMKSTNISEFADRRIDSLSGGQRQRAFIAMTLAQDTEIIILDEPTTYLDMSHQIEILGLLREINQTQNKTIVIVLHELNHASKYADHLIGMKTGKIIFEGAPKSVITPENLKILYNIDAKLEMDPTDSYPVCIDYELAKN